MSRYAEGTDVPVSKSRIEIEDYAKRRGATQFASGYLNDRVGVSFVVNSRVVRFTIPMPSGKKTPASEREERRLWRCLLLAIKAKFSTVDSGIETFEEAFLANIVTTDNMTVWERIQLKDSGVRLLPAPGAH